MSADPAPAFAELLTFLGVPPCRQPSEYWATTTVNSSYVADLRPADPWADMPPAQRARFAEIAGPLMVELGYCTDADLAAA